MSRDAARVDSGSRDVDKRCPAESAWTVSRRMCYLSAALGAGQSPILSRVFARTAVNSRGSHGTADHRIHRTRHHGPAHGEEPHQGRLPAHRAQSQPRARRRRRQVGRQGRVVAQGRRGPVRRAHHDAAQLAGGRAGRAGQEGRARPRAAPDRARGRTGGIEVPGTEKAELHRRHLQSRLQDRPALQGPRADHGVRARAGRALAGHGRGPGALQRDAGEGPRRPRPLGDHHAAGRPRGRSVRATVDRAGLDPQGRLPKVQVRRVRKGDLSRVKDVLEQTFGDFLERQLGTRPRQAFSGAQYVHHRWLMEPWGCFVAEEDNAKIVGTALAVAWGSVGLLGPVAVLTNYQNQTIGQQLIRATQEFFDENKTTLQGVMTYPTSPKHLALYHKFGYRPKALTALMSRVLDRNAPRPATKLARGPLVVRRFSQLEETKKKAGLARVHRITNALYRGLDVAKEVEIVDGLALGDTLLLERGRDLVGFAVVHTPGVSEAPFGTLYVKYMAVDPAQKRVEHLEQFVAAVEDLGHELGVQRVALPVYLRYWLAYSTLVRCGYQVDFTMLRMQKGKQEDYEDPTHLVLDDWR